MRKPKPRGRKAQPKERRGRKAIHSFLHEHRRALTRPQKDSQFWIDKTAFLPPCPDCLEQEGPSLSLSFVGSRWLTGKGRTHHRPPASSRSIEAVSLNRSDAKDRVGTEHVSVVVVTCYESTRGVSPESRENAFLFFVTFSFETF